MSDVIKSKIILDNQGSLFHETTQPTEDMILERNKQLRNNPGSIQDLGSQLQGGVWGRQIASIPFIVYEKAIRDGYDLNSSDSDRAEKELYRFLQSEEGKKCLVR